MAGAARAAGAVGPSEATGEVVLIMGLAGAGKSTLAARFVADGYHRLNRDDAGGTLRGLVPVLERARGEGATRFVLDNTYMTRKSRAAVIAAARRLGLAARCPPGHLHRRRPDQRRHSPDRAARTAAGRRGAPRAARGDAGAFGPGAQFRLQRELEPPTLAEGFSHVETVAFERRRPPIT